jgi:Uma2 family endonuclease
LIETALPDAKKSAIFLHMTAVARSSQWISPEEYLEGEKTSVLRHEYIDGAVYAMAGASDDHNRVNRLRGSRCEAFINDMKVQVSRDPSLFYYPDVLVTCDPSDNDRYFRERPSIIFEVLSPETERVDRREKLLAYREISALRCYVLLEQDRLFATIYRRTGSTWATEYIQGVTGIIHLPEINAELPLQRLYERTAASKEG